MIGMRVIEAQIQSGLFYRDELAVRTVVKCREKLEPELLVTETFCAIHSRDIALCSHHV